MTDITSFMTFFIDSFISMLTSVFNHLSNIQFFGISLLSYIIALFVLSVAVPIIVSIVSGGYTSSRDFFRYEHLHARRVAEAEARYESYKNKKGK